MHLGAADAANQFRGGAPRAPILATETNAGSCPTPPANAGISRHRARPYCTERDSLKSEQNAFISLIESKFMISTLNYRLIHKKFTLMAYGQDKWSDESAAGGKGL